MADTVCSCSDPDWNWTSDPTNEAGWVCGSCLFSAPGEPPGFRPDLDRAETEEKALAILTNVHDSELLSISNSDEGDSIIGRVVRACHDTGHFDSYSILRFILEAVTPSHAAYWGRIGEGVLCGSDPRPRCHCGRLSMCSRGSGHYCEEHKGSIFGDPIEAPGPGGSHA